MSSNSSGSLAGVYTSSSKFYYNPSTGTLNSTDYNSFSDESLKENIQPIKFPMDVLREINPVQFNWKNNGRLSFGIIAQEIEKILPSIVETDEQGIKSVSYLQLISFLIAALKEQDEQLRNLINKR